MRGCFRAARPGRPLHTRLSSGTFGENDFFRLPWLKDAFRGSGNPSPEGFPRLCTCPEGSHSPLHPECSFSSRPRFSHQFLPNRSIVYRTYLDRVGSLYSIRTGSVQPRPWESTFQETLLAWLETPFVSCDPLKRRLPSVSCSQFAHFQESFSQHPLRYPSGLILQWITTGLPLRSVPAPVKTVLPHLTHLIEPLCPFH